MYGTKVMLVSCDNMAANPCQYFDVDCSGRFDNVNNLIKIGDDYAAEKES